ncbi:hypothetical protein E4K67_17515 [Desulfosporosinus fructosivorans]|uniref:Phage tail protein n=1 Tax=Desulfosporosinus fructosivorans TaxID=2018669 RepID=A0A4Z0R4G6_9FIRM|nr:hypothetical protein [Desulfosporosinus fructosivorans]TGE36897.1 hypothetical protein E4K67_17515 [Desulfosporosinus fructosivorans]
MGLAKLLSDLAGTPVPQFLKRDGLSYEAIKGANGAMDVNLKDAGGGVNALAVNSDGSVNTKLTGRLVNEPFTGSTTVTHTFTKPMREFFISNDGDSNLTITINNMTFTVYPFTSFDEAFEPFTFVNITTEGPYQAWGRA